MQSPLTSGNSGFLFFFVFFYCLHCLHLGPSPEVGHRSDVEAQQLFVYTHPPSHESSRRHSALFTREQRKETLVAFTHRAYKVALNKLILCSHRGIYGSRRTRIDGTRFEEVLPRLQKNLRPPWISWRSAERLWSSKPVLK